MNIDKITIEYNPPVSDDQLWDFYVRNDICEVGFGRELAVKPLRYNPYIVGAFYEDKLVGIIRAAFDGLSAVIIEFCLELDLQGENLKYDNGSIIEKDKHGIARRMGLLLVDELRKLGNSFVTAYPVTDAEEDIYSAIGLRLNKGHSVFIRDERPYITSQDGGSET